MTSRRSFLAAILALLGWKPKPAEPQFPCDVTMRPVSQVFPDNTYVIIVDNNRINLWPTLGGPDKC